MYNRSISKQITESLYQGKIIIIYGARQVGKTTLSKQILEEQKTLGKKCLYLNCELMSVKSRLETDNEQSLKDFFGDNNLVILDEAQTISEIGRKLKILVDTYPKIQIIATGSSSFSLANQIGEPLVGRSRMFIIYPLSILELKEKFNNFELDSKIENILRFGAYPAIVDLPDSMAAFDLDNLTGSYLYKDILAFENIKNSSVISKLLKLLALQVGNEVSINELSTQLNISSQTVKKYIDLLEKNFIIFSLSALSKNIRKEISKSSKIYFYDLGIRNAIINNFNTIDNRNDVGALWENFCILERMKINQLKGIPVKKYFWRTYNEEEVDYIEEYNGQFFGYEFKYSKDTFKTPKAFLDLYNNTEVKLVNKKNYLQFLSA